MTDRRETRPATPGTTSARPEPEASVRAREALALEAKLLSDFSVPPPHVVTRTPVVAADPVPNEAPRVTALPTRRVCLMVSHQDAASLVVALGATLRLGAGATTTLSADELVRLRSVAALLHRILPAAARDVIRQRAACMTPDA